MLAEQRVAALQGQQEALLQQMLPSQVISKLLGFDSKPSPAQAAPALTSAQQQAQGLSPAEMQTGDHTGQGATPCSQAEATSGAEAACSASDLANAPEPEPEPGPEADVPDLPGALEQPPHDPFPHPTSCASATPQPAQTPGLETMLSLDRLSLDGLPQLTRRDVMELATMHEEVSILFTDIQNFTAMSQQLHPGQVMLFLNHIFSLFDDLLEDHDCYKVETIGDCYMVCAGLFDRSERTSGNCKNGLPAKNSGTLGGHDPAHAQKLLSFGKVMVRTASRVTDPLGEPVRMRVGLHCGPVMSGVVGRRMPRFCLFGDTVNTASRMQSTGQVGRIHVSQAFMSQLPHEAWQETQGVEVKGKGWMQTAFLADIDA
ncbi:guanylate cyclase [Haematococcus lacustris]